jgi:hypothetical protein
MVGNDGARLVERSPASTWRSRMRSVLGEVAAEMEGDRG